MRNMKKCGFCVQEAILVVVLFKQFCLYCTTIRLTTELEFVVTTRLRVKVPRSRIKCFRVETVLGVLKCIIS